MIKNNIGNREAKELICVIHGHEQRGRYAEPDGTGVAGIGGKMGETWDNCNSIIMKSI